MTPVSDTTNAPKITTSAPISPAPAITAAVPAVKVGDRVWYMAHMDHHLDTDHRGTPLFEFSFAKNYGSARFAYKQGDRVTDFGSLGRMKGMKKDFRRQVDGTYLTRGGHTIRVVGPGEPWPAIVREVLPDGSFALDIAHPVSGSLLTGHKIFDGKVFMTLHYPDHAVKTGGVRYSNKFEPHTFHLLSDRKAV